MRTFQLSKKKGNEHWTRPVVDREAKTIRFVVQDHDDGVPKRWNRQPQGGRLPGLSDRSSAGLRTRAWAGRRDWAKQMIGIVAEGDRKRLFSVA